MDEHGPVNEHSTTLVTADWHQAHELCHEIATALPAEQVPLDGVGGHSVVGRTLAADLVALCDVPHYASSAMDGWAVAGVGPWRLVETPELPDTTELSDGQATPIVTGGLVPVGAISIVRSEHGAVTDGPSPELSLLSDVPPGTPIAGRNIRRIGEEVQRSDVVIRAGTVLNPAHIAVAAVCGHDVVTVHRVPRVALVLTGDEVVTSGVPAPGFVRDTFGPQLPALIGMLGGMSVSTRRIDDSLQTTLDAIGDNTDGADLIITTGGTSRSRVDHLHPALKELGATLLVDGVNMRPGAPSLVARLPDGRFLIGLPGNPLAAMTGMLSLAQPLLARLLGRVRPKLGQTVLGHELSPAGGSSRLIPYRLVEGRAVQSEWLGSGMLRGLAEADGILICPPAGAHSGDELETLPLPWL